MSTIGAETFNLNKTEFGQKLGRIITNHRAGSRIIGESRDFVLRACKLTEQWSKLANDPETLVYLRNIDIAGGRKIKMLSLERSGTKQPVPKQKLVDALYPPKKTATSATPEEKHYNAVRVAMRFAVTYQLKAFRDGCVLPIICHISGKKIIPGSRTDVDHCGLTFSEIADSFIESRGLKYTDVILVGPPTAKRFKDTKLWEEWTYYHLQRARFSLTLASANRSKGAGGYCTNVDLIGSFAATDSETLSLDF
jgi:hypothetical protein